MTYQDTQTLRGYFGSFPASAANEACSVVASIRAALSDDALRDVTAAIERNSAAATDNNSSAEYFGRNIKYVSCCEAPADEGMDLSWMDCELLSDDDDDNESDVAAVTKGSGFDMRYRPPQEKAAEEKPGKPSVPRGAGQRIGMDWLRGQVEKYFGAGETGMGLTSGDLCTSVFDLLCSPKSNTELQAEVGDGD